MKFPPGEANGEIKWISLLYRNPGNVAVCDFAVDYPAAARRFYTSPKHMGMCPSVNQQERAVAGQRLALLSACGFLDREGTDIFLRVCAGSMLKMKMQLG